MADKKRDILEFVEQSNFEQFTPTLYEVAGFILAIEFEFLFCKLFLEL
jgi:hypothetical protein